jgi:Tetratricopeptide repeat
LGPEHPATLTTRNNLARWTGEAGDAAGVRGQFAELLPVQERILGPEHPHTLTTRSNLARWTGEAGDAAGARGQFAELLPVQERILGPSTRPPWPPGTTSPPGRGRLPWVRSEVAPAYLLGKSHHGAALTRAC